MSIFDRFKPEKRGDFDRENVPSSAANFFERMGWASSTTVTIESALGVPAVWAAVQFLSGTLAGLPLHVYKRGDEGDERVKGGVATIINRAVNDGMTAFDWRKTGYEAAFTGGRFVSYIERDGKNVVQNIYPIDPATLVVKAVAGKKVYQVKLGGSKTVTYAAHEVIDIPFMLKSNMVQHRSPIMTNKRTIALAISAAEYGAKAFDNGGVPPLVATGPFATGAGAQRASDDLAKAMESANKDGRQILTMPAGHDLKVLGFNARDMQLIELQRFTIEEIARIYSLPPVFLQDLTHGTFSNTEQQDLHFVKHTIKRWVEQSEQEMTLKLFGRGSDMYVKYNVDGLLRGDFKARMEAHASSIQNAIRTPNEARALENLPPLDGGDNLMIQGGTVPIVSQGSDEGDDDE